MTQNKGFTLIELIVFIVVLSLLSGIVLTATLFALHYSPTSHKQTVATTIASGCMEYILGQRQLKGFNFNSQTCPGGTADTTVPPFCSNLTSTDFTTTVQISCAPNLVGGPQIFKLTRVETTAAGFGSVVVNSLMANY